MNVRYCAIALGSNKGNRLDNLSKAIGKIKDFAPVIALSTIYESPALLTENAPEEWNKPYLNMVIKISTALEPHTLLAKLKDIEHQLGRINRGKWSPREIDLDIICVEDLIMESEALTIPHPQMCSRNFVIIPLAEIWLDWKHPHLELTAQELSLNMEALFVAKSSALDFPLQ